MHRLRLAVMEPAFAVAQFGPAAQIPAWALQAPIVSITRTNDELSIVAFDESIPEMDRVSRGWRALKLAGPFDFALTGVLESVLGPLASAGISIFAISTFDTDYVLVKQDSLDGAIAALNAAGHYVERS
jgi:uncharacterized protein